MIGTSRFTSLFSGRKPIIGVIHLPPLPGYPESPGIEASVAKALVDLDAFHAGPVDGVLVENEEDRPHRVEASRETIAAMTRVCRELVLHARVPVGVEILLNDPEASLAVASMAGAAFIRTDYFVDPMERPEHGGRMRIDPDALIRYRSHIGAQDVLVLADIQVKYARMLVERGLAESARLAREAAADAVLVTGRATGEPPSVPDLEESKQGAGDLPVLVGSGLDLSNVGELLRVADGAVVGTSLKQGDYVAAEKVIALVREARR
ncbi:MAG TPA: BtpA/SgcQ family protein [Vicinamibacteria bacterium]|nr:BtpA/SgcQ family protein [Vicinamibacteria bacterium]